MFSLHETTRKYVCRSAFFLLCALPTVATLSWAGYTLRPNGDRQRQDALSARLHVAARVDGTQIPRPRETFYETVVLAEIQRGRPLADLQDVRFRIASGRQSLTIEAADVHETGLPELAARAAEWLAREPGAFDLRIGRAALVRPHADIDDQQHGQQPALLRLHNVVGRMETIGGDARGAVRRLTMRANAIGQGATHRPLKFIVERWVEEDHVMLRSQIDLTSAGIALPLVSGVIPALDRQTDALLVGNLQVNARDDSVSGVFVGRIENINLAKLLPADSPHRLDGIGALDAVRLAWRDGSMERMEGELRAAGGTASRSLYAAAVQKLGCVDAAGLLAQTATRYQPNPTVAHQAGVSALPDQIAPFDSLACRFLFDQSGLTLWGICDAVEGAPSGCLVSAGGRALLLEPKYVELPMGNWVQFFTAPSPSWLPATREAVETARRLPLSNAAPK